MATTAAIGSPTKRTRSCGEQPDPLRAGDRVDGLLQRRVRREPRRVGMRPVRLAQVGGRHDRDDARLAEGLGRVDAPDAIPARHLSRCGRTRARDVAGDATIPRSGRRRRGLTPGDKPMIEFQRSARELELEARTAGLHSRDGHPVRARSALRRARPERRTGSARCAARRARAGLLAPQVGAEWGGLRPQPSRDRHSVPRSGLFAARPDRDELHGARRRQHAPARESGDAGSRKSGFCKPLAAGKARSAFLMTEPDGGAGSDPSMLQTRARSRTATAG